MAPRPYWKGYLKLSLVTCPVSLTPATSDREKVRFHTVNAETGNRVRSRYVDAGTGDPVDDGDEVRGFETEEKTHIVIEDEELESVGLESTRTVDIERFVPADSIEWVWYDSPYYLMPDDEVAQEAFAVIREAMAATGTVGISRLVLARRERAVLLQPRGKGIVLWTLRYGDEVRDPAEIFGGIEEKKPETQLVGLVRKLIDDLTQPWDESLVRDPVQERLKEIIASKAKKGKSPPKPQVEHEPEAPTNVVSIMDALRRSISQEKAPVSGRTGEARTAGPKRPASRAAAGKVESEKASDEKTTDGKKAASKKAAAAEPAEATKAPPKKSGGTKKAGGSETATKAKASAKEKGPAKGQKKAG